MDDQKNLEAEDFIPHEEEDVKDKDVDIYELLFNELTSIMQDRDSSSEEVTAWMIGDKLRRVLGIVTDKKKGKEAFELLQKQISKRFGAEFTSEKLHESIKIADEFPDLFLFSEMTDYLNMEHIRALIEVESDLARTYYSEMSKAEKWTPDQLKEKINSKAFEKEYGEEA